MLALLALLPSVAATNDMGCCAKFYGDSQANVCDACPANATCRDNIVRTTNPLNGDTLYKVDSTKKDCVIFEYDTIQSNTTNSSSPDCPPGWTFVNGSECPKEVPNSYTLQEFTVGDEALELYAPVPLDTKYTTTIVITMPYTIAQFNETMQDQFKDGLAQAANMSRPFYGSTEIVTISPGQASEYPSRELNGAADHVTITAKLRTTEEEVIAEAQDELGVGDEAVMFGRIAAALADAGISDAPIHPFSITHYCIGSC